MRSWVAVPVVVLFGVGAWMASTAAVGALRDVVDLLSGWDRRDPAPALACVLTGECRGGDARGAGVVAAHASRFWGGVIASVASGAGWVLLRRRGGARLRAAKGAYFAAGPDLVPLIQRGRTGGFR